MNIEGDHEVEGAESSPIYEVIQDGQLLQDPGQHFTKQPIPVVASEEPQVRLMILLIFSAATHFLYPRIWKTIPHTWLTHHTLWNKLFFLNEHIFIHYVFCSTPLVSIIDCAATSLYANVFASGKLQFSGSVYSSHKTNFFCPEP